MKDLIVIAILVFIVGIAAGYVYKAKKRGVKCIGCPEGCKGCSGNGCCGDYANSEKESFETDDVAPNSEENKG